MDPKFVCVHEVFLFLAVGREKETKSSLAIICKDKSRDQMKLLVDIGRDDSSDGAEKRSRNDSEFVFVATCCIIVRLMSWWVEKSIITETVTNLLKIRSHDFSE